MELESKLENLKQSNSTCNINSYQLENLKLFGSPKSCVVDLLKVLEEKISKSLQTVEGKCTYRLSCCN